MLLMQHIYRKGRQQKHHDDKIGIRIEQRLWRQGNLFDNKGILTSVTMYPYLFLYVGAFLRICRVSIGLSYKTVVFLANLGSAVCAYYAFKSLSKSRRTVILAVVLYTLMPYRFTNIFSRGDLGETLALTFWPLVVAGVYHVMLGDRKKWPFLVIGFSGILQSHILSVTFVMGFCVIACVVFAVNVWKDRRYRKPFLLISRLGKYPVVI